jgi:hypothetical protein
MKLNQLKIKKCFINYFMIDNFLNILFIFKTGINYLLYKYYKDSKCIL